MKKNRHCIKVFSSIPVFLMMCLFFTAFVTSCTKTEFTESKEEVADKVAPTVVSVDPGNNISAVSLTAKPSVIFSESMNGTTLTTASFTVKKGSTALTGTVAYSGTTATFDPSASLEANTIYTCTITTSAKDASGNALAANYTWSFTTGTLADVTAPTVLSVAPSANATSVAVGIKPTVTFSEAMSSTSITASTFTLKQGTTTVAGSVSYSGTTATFTPSAALAGNKVYTVTVTNAVKDVSGNALASNYTWSFTTIATAAGKSFSADVVPILNLCNTCHNHNWTPSSTPSTFHANLVQSGHINTTTPTNGKIYNKMSGGHPSSTVSSAQKTTVLTWIQEGSKNN